MLNIITHTRNPFTLEFAKWFFRVITRKSTGPKAVEDSLIRGLDARKIKYSRNSTCGKSGDILLVLSGATALQDAIKQKRRNPAIVLIAGPNIIQIPTDYDGIIFGPEIDAILLPSKWIKDLWISLAPELEGKLYIWPTGVAESPASSRDGAAIVYNKLLGGEMASEVVSALTHKEVNTCLLNYGNFQQKEFFKLLESAPFLIYLGSSETQGIALQEAWSRDIPTFVYFTGKVATESFSWSDESINAPYLVPELGKFFISTDDLLPLAKGASTIHPRNYCMNNLSDAQSLLVLERIINKLGNNLSS